MVDSQQAGALIAPIIARARYHGENSGESHGTYTDKEGNERASFEIVAQNLQFLDAKGSGGGNSAPAPKQDNGGDFNDDIPF